MLILPSASSILCSALIPGQTASGSKLDIAYLEYVNGPAVSPPDINPSESVEYYQRLDTTPDRDYLRCPVLTHMLNRSGEKTVLSLIVVSDGDGGIHGKPFSAAAGSKVYGIALAASQTNNRGDILFARHYYEPAEQAEKPENGNVMLSLNLVLS